MEIEKKKLHTGLVSFNILRFDLGTLPTLRSTMALVT